MTTINPLLAANKTLCYRSPRSRADLISACRRYKNVAKAWLEFETFKTRIGKADAGFFMPAVFLKTKPPIYTYLSGGLKIGLKR